LTAKALNSLITPIGYFLVTDEVGKSSVNQQDAFCSKHLLTELVGYFAITLLSSRFGPRPPVRPLNILGSITRLCRVEGGAGYNY